MSVGEEYHAVREGREYHSCWEEYNVDKWKQYHRPYNIKAVGKNIKKRKEDRIFGEGNQDIKKLGWRIISSCRELYTLLNFCCV